MKRADILTFAGAIVIVIIIAIASQGIDSIPGIGSIFGQSSHDLPYEIHEEKLPVYIMHINPQIWNIPKNTDLNTVYMSGGKGYPVTEFPPSMTHFGASDANYAKIWKKEETIQFAKYTGPGSGFSEMFPIPFGFWRINASMNAAVKPESSQLKWVLVNNENGAIITGNEMRYNEHVLKTVQSSGESFYFMVSAQDVTDYTFTLETTKTQYGDALIQPSLRRITTFLNYNEK